MINRSKNPIFSVFLTIFLDLLGIGLVIPVMAPLILQNQTGLFPADFAYSGKTIIYGFLLGTFPLAQFISNPIIGSLSDIYGRRRILIYSLWGAIFGYIIFIWGLLSNNIYLIFLGRIIPGISSGNITIAYSALADISNEQNKTKNFGLIGMAFGLGFIIGPFAGGELANKNLVSWFGNETPFIVSTLLAILNLIIVWLNFPETLKTTGTKKVTLLAGIHNINKAFTNSSLRSIFTIVFTSTFGFAFFTQFFIVLLMGKYNYNQANIGMLFGYLGLWVVITQGWLLRIISKRLRPEKILLFSMPILFAALFSMLLPDKSFWLYIIIPFMAFGNSTTMSSITAVVSNLGDDEIQGEILGISQSMNSLAAALPALIGGFFVAGNFYRPVIVSVIFAFISWLLYIFYYKMKHHDKFSIEENVIQ